MQSAEFKPFNSLNHVIQHLAAHEDLWYKAPMDLYPVRVEVKRFLANNVFPAKSTVTVHTRATGQFTFNISEHFERLLKKIDGKVLGE